MPTARRAAAGLIFARLVLDVVISVLPWGASKTIQARVGKTILINGEDLLRAILAARVDHGERVRPEVGGGDQLSDIAPRAELRRD